MKIRLTAAALCLLALPALAQDKPKEPAAPAMGNAELAAMMKAMTPGEPHKHLARMAGNWTYSSKMWMDPSTPPMESGGTMQGEMLLGGRYLQQTWKGNFMGMDFEGRATYAYDNVGKEYASAWIDNMGSCGIIYATGTCDAATKSCKHSGDFWDPMTNKKNTMKTVTTWTDDNTFRQEMYGNDPSGKEVKMMEFVVTRKTA
jgi:Protein of unknown function (DUF1579)